MYNAVKQSTVGQNCHLKQQVEEAMKVLSEYKEQASEKWDSINEKNIMMVKELKSIMEAELIMN